ncbi:MAG: exopolyphosphatase [Desulfobacteraceae bacterium]|nr:exopolyphosphatase [Desulfobacteraceae bacterium]
MRIVTRPDLDGIVCAVLLYEALDIRQDVYWVEPNQIQNNECDIKKGDILANLPYHENASMWFDHHVSNTAVKEFEGRHEIAPSAAGVIYGYYSDIFKDRFKELIINTDKIDSADLSIDEVNFPEKYPYVLLSMTIKNRQFEDVPYWEKLINLLRTKDINEIMKDTDVEKRCNKVIEENIKWKNILNENTIIDENVSILDLRPFETKAPSGNRFLIYSMFPKTNVSVKIRYADDNPEKVIVSIGHSIFNKTCNVNIGKLLSKHNGGGHKGAGAFSVEKKFFDEKIKFIVSVLKENKPFED